jgi:hypothetical protein
VIRVVYAILALLMGASLFLVVGPVNIGALVGNSSSTSSAATALQEQAERIERRLAKNPDDEQLLVALTRARIGAGNAQLEGALESETPIVPPAAHEEYEVALQAWNRYLKQAGKEPSPSAAQLVAVTYFTLAEKGSTSLEEIQTNVNTAATAQQIVVDKQPSLGSFSQLAIYRYYEGSIAAGDRAAKQAATEATGKAEAKGIEKQLAEYRKRAVKFHQSVKTAEKQAQKAGREQLQKPPGLGASPGAGLGE